MRFNYQVFLLFAVCCYGSVTLRAANYYFSSGSGDDGHSMAEAQHAATPWRSLQQLARMMHALQPGDSVLFKRGEVFEGQITVTCSGDLQHPIVFGAYGKGSDPVINGLMALSGWKELGHHIFETTVHAGARINVLLLDGKMRAMGRWPNAGDPQKGYLTVKAVLSNTRIRVDGTANGKDWTNGELVVRKARWILDRNRITGQAGDSVTYIPPSGSAALVKYGCFIQNHPATLDQSGEWYYDPLHGKMQVYWDAGGRLPAAAVSVQDSLVVIKGQSHLVFRDLVFEGANVCAFAISKGSDIGIAGCSIRFSGGDAIDAYGTARLSLQGSMISYTNNNAVYTENCPYTQLTNNSIRCTGLFPGMGGNNSGSYEAILSSGDYLLVENNKIDSTGYMPICFRGDSVVVKNNLIDYFGLVKDDGGGIYTWNNPAHPPVYHYRLVQGNIILHGLGAGEGTDNPGRPAIHGIYMDDNAGGVEISGNTAAGCNGYGIFLHNAHDIVLQHNIIYNNQTQWVLAHDRIAPNSPIRNIRADENVFFAASAQQKIVDYKMSKDDSSSLGGFSNNKYIGGMRPESVRLEYNASGKTRKFMLPGSFTDAEGRNYTGSAEIDPHRSLVLIKKAP